MVPQASTVRITSDRPAPKPVAYEALAAKREKLSGNIQSEFISMGVDALFTAPTLVLPAGTADHWPLEQAESKELVKRLEAVIAMLPRKKKTAAERLLAKFGPPLLLLGTAGLITVPRILQTRELLAQRKRQLPAPQPTPTQATSAHAIHPTEAGTSVNGNESANVVARSGNGDIHSSTNGNARTRFSAINAEVTDFKAL